jgi:TetR/AcrR family transcriptional regulator
VRYRLTGAYEVQNEKLPRREREKLRQRQEIIAIALNLFSEKGYHSVSMHEVAEKAEFAIGTLYKFFQSKEDLYKALVIEQCAKIHDAIVAAIDSPEDEVKRLQVYVRTKGEMFQNNLAFIRLYLAESRGISYIIKAGLDEEVRKGYYDLLKRLSLIFESGIKNKRFKPIATPYYLAVTLDSAVNSFHLLWLDAPDRHPYPEDPDTILNIFFSGLIDP